MIEVGDIVTLNFNHTRTYLPSEMITWMQEHKDKKFYVEQVVGGAAKLAKVYFWITEDLLEKVKKL